ncbi:MAG: hypothetical protein RIT04_435 [Candidatus Parcubacteria bacterium]
MKIFNKVKKWFGSFIKDPFFLYRWDWEHTHGYRRPPRTDNQLHENIYGGCSHDPYYLRSDTHMLIEDLHTGVTPFLGLRRRNIDDPSFVFADTIEHKKERIVINGISGRERGFDITEVCLEFIRETTKQLMAYGVVYYELVYELEASGDVKSFSLESIPSGYLIKFFNNYYQVIPWWVASGANTKVGIIKIPADKVLRIKFPKNLGGKRELKRILSRLYKISSEPLPSFTMESMKKNEDTGFDTNEYSKNKYLETARLTKIFGWNQRARTNSYATEYYYFKRYLDSEMSHIIFREHILNKLNDFLNGPIVKMTNKIEMRGFVTREELTSWKERMQQGGIKLIDMFNSLKDR